MYNRILVPLDGSELAECSLEHVKEVALGCHVPEVVLLAVVEPFEESMPSFWGGVAGRQTQMEAGKDTPTTAVVDFKQMTSEQQAAEIEKRQQVLADDYLCRVAERLAGEGLSVKVCALSGKAADTILSYARENSVDLIVMATHGKGDNASWDIGKVADKVIRGSNVPVLIAAPTGCRL
jgi:nucleotide-binding universal stress UspA family protein